MGLMKRGWGALLSTVRSLGCYAYRFMGLGFVERGNRQDRSEELSFAHSHAYCFDESDIGQQ
jgi:hypothetical protein